jgi:hypothetical protein
MGEFAITVKTVEGPRVINYGSRVILNTIDEGGTRSASCSL